MMTHGVYSGRYLGTGSRALYNSLSGLALIDIIFASSYIAAWTALFSIFFLASRLRRGADT
jgi:hypothetical protein